jgi:indole-3-glycerol phosphate synthase
MPHSPLAPNSGGTILDTILAYKHTEVRERQKQAGGSKDVMTLYARTSLYSARHPVPLPPPRNFLAALQTPKIGPVALIAEVKQASPSAGLIRDMTTGNLHPAGVAHIYEANGASCLSVLTDERFFQGHDTYLEAIRATTSLPVIRKDFVVSDWQIYESRALGADAILLIVAALTPTQIADYQAIAHELGMAALVEVHTESEMEVALGANAMLIGINSRNLNTFVTDLGTVKRLAALVPPDVTLVAESGLKTPADVKRVAEAGAKAILVGETLMRSPDIGAATRALLAG